MCSPALKMPRPLFLCTLMTQYSDRISGGVMGTGYVAVSLRSKIHLWAISHPDHTLLIGFMLTRDAFYSKHHRSAHASKYGTVLTAIITWGGVTYRENHCAATSLKSFEALSCLPCTENAGVSHSVPCPSGLKSLQHTSSHHT